ncbi:hypothetical protein BBK82_11520 [Lentzea guizhouensis]|uniref:DUF2771 domain-containing protein n=1 Tax=Lentzea guizhouensis TaxID=1586287 RepID=A0A1B2HFY0_9PSEU|nr:DUF2771 family protein [Lentzea guizhouensis]ANZ36601.1 hypothetical protein BBK82_11520 [Lentzea guizhouensis]
MRRLASVLAVSVLVLTGCSLPRHYPEVTFHANGKTIRVEPAVYCDLGGDNCAERAQPAKLKVPAGKVVQISVDGQLADGLWEAVFLYRDAAGKEQTTGTGLLGKGENFTYTLSLPDKADQLLGIEVHEAAAAVLETGQPLLRGYWAVEVTS